MPMLMTMTTAITADAANRARIEAIKKHKCRKNWFRFRIRRPRLECAASLSVAICTLPAKEVGVGVGAADLQSKFEFAWRIRIGARLGKFTFFGAKR